MMTPPLSILDDQYWTGRYKEQQTGWDIGYPSTPLKEYIDELSDKSLKILIPGCGNAYEADYLIQQGFKDVTLVDISEELVNNLKAKFSGKPVKIIHEDFFLHSGKYDLILEQTFFCALHPSQRVDYAIKMKDLLKPGGKLVGLLFNKEFEGGPPFGGSKEEYRKLFSKYFAEVKIESCYNSIPPRKDSEVFFSLKND
jgi:SAM-dependent methyltransferase